VSGNLTRPSDDKKVLARDEGVGNTTSAGIFSTPALGFVAARVARGKFFLPTRYQHRRASIVENSR
jgi:hypothetical protein